MHELAITQEIVRVVEEQAAGSRVTRVVVEIGRVSGILADSVRFCFDLCAKGTVAEGAELTIDEIAGRARCRLCSAQLELDEPFGLCACGSADLEVLAGQELRVREMEVDGCAPLADARTAPARG